MKILVSLAVLLGACSQQPQPYDPVTASIMLHVMDLNNANQRATNDNLTHLFSPPPVYNCYRCY